MFRFFKEFRISTSWDYVNDEAMMETKDERHAQFDDICKHFGIAWSKGKLRILPYPPGMQKRDNIVMLNARGAEVQVSWKCFTTPEKWTQFCDEVNDYVKDKDYADFIVYSTP